MIWTALRNFANACLLFVNLLTSIKPSLVLIRDLNSVMNFEAMDYKLDI